MSRRSLTAAAILFVACGGAPALAQQMSITSVDAMPSIPVAYQYLDYTAIATGFDSTVFNPTAVYQYPVFWFDRSAANGISSGFGMPSYIGQTQATVGSGEAITTIGAVLGATLAGIDKHSQTLSNGGTYDFVYMVIRYYDSDTHANIVMNNIGTSGTGSFWYDQLPSIMYYGLIDKYYNTYAAGGAGRQRLDTVMNGESAKLHQVINVLAGGSTTATPNFNHQGFNYASMVPINGDHTEPDGAAGVAWLQYMAYEHTGNSVNLSDAQRCMSFINGLGANQNPYYETILPFGALLAARMNAEQGTNYDVKKIVNWCFNANSSVRPDWGAITASNWGGYGVSGLIGSTTDNGGYGFSMNTYVSAMALVPLVRYDNSFANEIGKWMLNLSNSSRLFLKSGLPASNQTNASWNDAPSNYYSYEGLKKTYAGVTPQGGGDGTGYNSNWLNFAYSSGDIGMLGSIIKPTNVSMILQLDLLATDFFHGTAYPSYLFYNPYSTRKTIQVNVGNSPVDIYDAVSGQMISSDVSGNVSVAIPAQMSRSLVYAPAGGAVVDSGTQVTDNGVVINPQSPELNRLYWDLNGTATGAGGPNLGGTWGSSTLNWDANSQGVGATATWTGGKVAMFAAGSDGTGTYTVAVSGTQAIGGIEFKSGEVTLQGGALSLQYDDATFTADAGVHTINSAIQGSYNILKQGPGTIVFGGANTYTGITSIEQGTLTIATGATSSSSAMNVAPGAVLNVNGSVAGTINADGAVNFGANTTGTRRTRSLTALNISSTGIVSLLPSSGLSNNTVMIVPTLSFGGSAGAWVGKLDVGNNDLIIPGGGSAPNGLMNITNEIAQGLDWGGGSGTFWNGPGGIVSSSAASNPLMALGVMQPLVAGTFDNLPVSPADIVVKYTLFGDANLDGIVDGNDYTLIDTGFNGRSTGWQNGDFNYDGVINGDDYTLIDNAFNAQGSLGAMIATLAAQADFGIAAKTSVTAVPEPGSLTAMMLSVLGLLNLRRRARSSL